MKWTRRERQLSLRLSFRRGKSRRIPGAILTLILAGASVASNVQGRNRLSHRCPSRMGGGALSIGVFTTARCQGLVHCLRFSLIPLSRFRTFPPCVIGCKAIGVPRVKRTK
jgi:hypothetical protein